MSQEIIQDGIRFIPVSDAAHAVGHNKAYLMRLCRKGNVRSRKIGNYWFVDAEQLKNFVAQQETARAKQYELIKYQRAREYQGHQNAAMMHVAPEALRTQSVAPQRSSHVSYAVLTLMLVSGLGLTAYASMTALSGSGAPTETAAAAQSSGMHGIASRLAQIWDGAIEGLVSLLPKSTVASTTASSTPNTQNAPTSVAPSVINYNTYNTTNNTTNNSYHTEAEGTAGISATDIQQELNAYANTFNSKLAQISTPTALPASGGIANEVALTQRIDQLTGTTFTDAVWHGGSISGATISGGSINADSLQAGSLTTTAAATLASTTIAGDLTVTGNFNFGGSISLDNTSFVSSTSTTFHSDFLTAAEATTTLLHAGMLTLDTALSPANGGTGTSSAPAYGQVLLGNGAGGYDLVATSSLGILAGGGGTWGSITGSLSDQTDLQNALNAKLSLTNWYATTTDALKEGTANLYYTPTRVNALISASTTIVKASGSPSYGQVLVGTASGGYSLVATSSLGIAGGGGGGSVAWGAITGSLSDQTDLQNALNARLSLAAWYATTTDALAQGTANKYYSNNLFAASLAGTTTTALAEGNNLYFTNNRVASVVAATTTDALREGTANLYYTDTRVNSFVAASSTIAKIFAANTWTPLQTFSTGFISNASSTVIGNFTSTGTIAGASFTGAGTGLTGNAAGLSIGGNAGTATKFATTKNINTVPFDGSADITITAASSTLLANNNTFSGTNAFGNTTFTNATTTNIFSTIASSTNLFAQTAALGSLSVANAITGSVTGNAGTVTNGVYTTTFNGLFDTRLLSTTTSALAEGSNLYYTDTRVNSYIAASSTIAKTFAANTWTAPQTFNAALTYGGVTLNNAVTGTGNLVLSASPTLTGTLTAAAANFSGNTTFTNATTTNLFSTTASSTNLFAQTSALGTLTLGTALSVSSGGTGITVPSAAGVLLGNYTGTGYQQIATSSLGLLTTDVAEGGNLYYTPARVAGVIAGTTTDALAQGTTNKYYSSLLFAADLSGTTTDAIRQGSVNKYYTDVQVNTLINASSTIVKAPSAASYGQVLVGTASGGYSLVATSSLGISSGGGGVAWGAITGSLSSQTDLQAALDAKLSLSAWYATTTDALAQGVTNKYYSTNLFAASLTGTTTDALREGTANLYYTDTRVNSFIAASSSIPKTFANNTFIGTNAFGTLTATNATTTNIFSTIASSTNLFAQTASLGSLTAGTLNLSALATFANGFVSQASSTVTGNFTATATSSFAGGITGPNNFVVQQGSGNVGIGNTAPTYKLDTTGAGHFTSFVDASNFVATSSSATSLFNGNVSVIGNTTLSNATSTNIFSTTASSTNLFAQTASFGTLSAGTLNLSGLGIFASGFLSQASSTIGNGTQTGGLTISGGATTTGSAYIGGNLGLGIVPAVKLDVNGPVRINPTTSIGSYDEGLRINSASDGYAMLELGGTGTNGSAAGQWQLFSDPNNAFEFRYNGTMAAAILPDKSFGIGPISNNPTTLAGANFVVTAAGNVGIGTTTPSQTLSVAGNVAIDSSGAPLLQMSRNSTSTSYLGIANGTGSFFSNNATNNLVLRWAAGQSFVLGADNGAGTASPAMVVTGSGNVGIGTTTPGTIIGTDQSANIGTALNINNNAGKDARLILQGTAAKIDLVNLAGASNAKWMQLVENAGLLTFRSINDNGGAVATDNILVLQNSGNVGIGISAPAAKLSVATTSLASFTGTSPGSVLLTDTGSVSNNYTALDFGTAAQGYGTARIASKYTGVGTYLNFGTSNNFASGITNTAMTIDPSGNVGIGTTTPINKLTLYDGAADVNLKFQTDLTGPLSTDGFNLGIQRSTSDVFINQRENAYMRFYTNGGERLTLDPSGNVGIGTTTPQGTLAVVGAANSIGALSVTSGTGNSTDMVFGVYGDTSPTQLFRFGVTRAGNVGIATTSPNGLLALQTNAGGNRFITVDDGTLDGVGSRPTLNINNGSVLGYFDVTGSTLEMVTKTASDLVFAPAQSIAMTIKNGGNVGIGTTTPQSKLSIEAVSGSGTKSGLLLSNTSSSIGDGTSIDFYAGAYNKNARIYNYATNANQGDLRFATANGTNFTDAMTILGTNQNVGIGTTSPTWKFAVNGGRSIFEPTDQYAIQISRTGNYSAGANNFVGPIIGASLSTTNPDLIFSNNSGTELMRLTDGGNLGIGVASPQATLHVSSAATTTLRVDSTDSNKEAVLFLADGSSLGGSSEGLKLSYRSSVGDSYFNNIYPATAAFHFQTGAYNPAGSDLMTILTSGNVGIGVSPSYKLDVSGDINTSGCFRVSGTCIGDTVVRLGSIQVLTSGTNATYTTPASTSYIVVEAWGGGGGGGGGTSSFGAGGGGGGGYASKFIAPTVAGTYVYTIGAAGGGGAASGAGSSGGSTCFAASGTACSSPIVSAAGGTNGAAGASGSAGGAGGAGSSGNVNLTGGSGLNAVSGSGGGGGFSPRAGAGGTQPSGAGAAGNNGIAYGGGGSGGGGGGSGGAGGSGAAGGIVVYEYKTVTTGTDLAENYPVSDPTIAAGDIVQVGGIAPITLQRADVSSSEPVVGVISTQPGLLLTDNATSTGERPVALSGRVPVKVNLEGGAIVAGDRITLSSVAGVGKKAGPFDSSVGVALEAYDGTTPTQAGEGMVTVFMNLQQGISLSDISMGLLGVNATSSLATSTPVSTSTPAYVAPTNFLTALFVQLGQWFASAGNGIENLYATVIHANEVHTKELCASKSDGTEVCVSGDQLAAFLASAAASGSTGNGAGSTEQGNSSSTTPTSSSTSTPVLAVTGNNPATVTVGDTYADLGATITGPSADTNLGIMASVDGGATTTVSAITIDTSVAGTHTIVYSATDGQGNRGSATRTVNVIDPNAGSTERGAGNTDDASSTDATSTTP